MNALHRPHRPKRAMAPDGNVGCRALIYYRGPAFVGACLRADGVGVLFLQPYFHSQPVLHRLNEH